MSDYGESPNFILNFHDSFLPALITSGILDDDEEFDDDTYRLLSFHVVAVQIQRAHKNISVKQIYSHVHTNLFVCARSNIFVGQILKFSTDI